MKLKEDILNAIGKEYEEQIAQMGFEIVGDIAIVEFKHELPENILGKVCDEIKKHHPSVGVIVKKIGDVSGEFRVGKYEVLNEYDRSKLLEHLPKKYRNLSPFETLHIEHGCRMLLDISKVYFSSKLGFERKRIAEQVKENENVAVLFAGIGPFPLVIAKHKKARVEGIELNPYAIEYFHKNLAINKLHGEINIIHADVKDWLNDRRDLHNYDRIVMPAPKDAPHYLEEVITKSKPNTIIHYYFFADKQEIENRINEIKEKFHEKVEVVYYRTAGSVGTNQYRVVADIKILK
ncbi:MAG: hypothetical protein GXN99_02860 [Candidatus Nanohaloarchaeota archaeon]|nr:hypothetical protein [Candidatus Nanohaloarchaeota archaeon]